MENEKFAIARNLVNGLSFGSTEFHILRASDVVLPEWIYYYYVWQVVQRLCSQTHDWQCWTKRVPVQFLKNIEIPLPTIDEQKKLIAYLNKIKGIVESLRRLVGIRSVKSANESASQI
ncbi:MAG: hypothetical protein RMH75_07295 [Archaeoglobaceae archaeon]|nr:hypothetical protein [Archaeoglobaceae archaeon]